MATICFVTAIRREVKDFADAGALLVCFESVFTGFCAGAGVPYELRALTMEGDEMCSVIRVPQADGFVDVSLSVDTRKAWTVCARYELSLESVDAETRGNLGRLVGAFLRACVSLDWAT